MSKISLFGGFSSLGSVAQVLMIPKMNRQSVVCDTRLPLPRPDAPSHAATTRHGVCADRDVFRILFWRCLSNIFPSIVSAVAVTVVKFFRPTSGHVEPREPVGRVGPTVNLDSPIPVGASAASQRSGLSFAANRGQPHKDASCLVVVHDHAQFFSGDTLCGSHRVPSFVGLRFGQGRFNAETSNRPANFSAIPLD